jgi:transcriptional regulator with XRE-family HTH domain
MNQKKSTSLEAVVAYPTLVGRAIASERDRQRLKQGDVAAMLGLSQSAYSRLESGDSVMNLAQLRSACTVLSTTPGAALMHADDLAEQLRQQGVEVVDAKPDNAGAIAIGLGLLTALLLASGG